ncbi:MAG: SDR family oxidoreductase [Planctomycetia bacterium]|nr:SDR family oxidoreductase [Planctomycetia bacterium]
MYEPLVFVPGALAQTGRVALVTGGERGMGAAVVRALASRGYAVAIHAHGSLQEARALADQLAAAGVPSLAVTANLRDEGPVRAMVQRVADHFGRIDAVVTCAAIRQAGPLEEVTADDLRTHFDINCVAAFVAAQEAGAFMVRQPEGGSIVMMGDSAVERPTTGSAAFFPSQGAITAMTQSLAKEFAARNPRVRANCVLAGTPAHREGTLEHVAHAVLFLLENDSVTGICLPVDGGTRLA